VSGTRLAVCHLVCQRDFLAGGEKNVHEKRYTQKWMETEGDVMKNSKKKSKKKQT
jgi:hypothetical protein